MHALLPNEIIQLNDGKIIKEKMCFYRKNCTQWLIHWKDFISKNSTEHFTKNNFAHSNSSRRISLYTFRSWNCYWTNCTKSIEEKPLFHRWTEFRAKITICEIISLKKCELPKKNHQNLENVLKSYMCMRLVQRSKWYVTCR